MILSIYKMDSNYHIARLASMLLNGRYMSSSCREVASRCFTAIRNMEGGSKDPPKLSVDVASLEKREPIMRINKGSMELSDSSLCHKVDDDLQRDMYASALQIDETSFKNYIEVPQQGILGEKTLRIFANEAIPFKQYREGMQSAHHYPLGLLPRKDSMKLSGDIFVTTFGIHEKDYRIDNGHKVRLSAIPSLKIQPNEVLLQKLYGRNSILIVFSGDLPHADAKGALEWKNAVDFPAQTHILLNFPCPIGMSYFHKRYLNSLASTLVEKNDFSCLVRKLKWEETIAFHQYRKQLSSLLLLDKFGYIRWHAVGRPSREATYLLREVYEKLLNEG